MKRVLITGCAGRIGGMLMTGLRRTGRYDVVATARRADRTGILAMDLRDAGTVKTHGRWIRSCT